MVCISFDSDNMDIISTVHVVVIVHSHELNDLWISLQQVLSDYSFKQGLPNVMARVKSVKKDTVIRCSSAILLANERREMCKLLIISMDLVMKTQIVKRYICLQ